MKIRWLEEAKAAWWKRQETAWKEAMAPQLQLLQAQLTQTEEALSTRLARVTEQEQAAKQLQQETERLKESLERQQRDLEDLLHRQEDRKAELASVNAELKVQIRLIEAKARPDAVWLTAFQAGYEKAWDTMLPLMTEGVQKAQATLYQSVMAAALKTVEPAIEQRVTERLQDIQRLRTFKELTAKRTEFEQKRIAAPVTDQSRYDHYLEALHWALDGHLPQP